MAASEQIGRIIFTEKEIRHRAAELGKEITRDYRESGSLVLLCTLKGALIWMGDIMKEIKLDTAIDFIAAGSYGSSTTTSGVVKITKDVSMDLYNRDILIVEDIIDTGLTLRYLVDHLKKRNPRSIKICTMLDKPSRRRADIQADYIGFTVEDLFIVGYGLDYDQKYRNLPYIGVLENE